MSQPAPGGGPRRRVDVRDLQERLDLAGLEVGLTPEGEGYARIRRRKGRRHTVRHTARLAAIALVPLLAGLLGALLLWTDL